MPNPNQPLPERKPLTGTQKGAGAIAAALAIAVPVIMQWEGKKNVTYADIIGVPTACWGHTGAGTGKIGTLHSDAECKTLLDNDVQTHMMAALKCVPTLSDRPNQLAGSTILTINIGGPNFCGSSAAKLFRAGMWRDGCNAFRAWNSVTYSKPQRGLACRPIKSGKYLCVIKGLVNRRESERAICLKGLA